MITPLDITHRETAQQVLDLQLPSYRVEAELTGFDGIPPLRDTVDTLISCGETFRGLYLDGELAGAISYKLEKNLLDIHRVMVHPRHFRKGVATALLNPCWTPHRKPTGWKSPPARSTIPRKSCTGGWALPRLEKRRRPRAFG